MPTQSIDAYALLEASMLKTDTEYESKPQPLYERDLTLQEWYISP